VSSRSSLSTTQDPCSERGEYSAINSIGVTDRSRGTADPGLHRLELAVEYG
jgi:hypothetical protein